jgi:hypothetical protein
LRIITTFPDPVIHRPIAIRHPALIKSAPLFARRGQKQRPHADNGKRNREIVVFALPFDEGENAARRAAGDKQEAREVEEVAEIGEIRREQGFKGHRRRLSDKFKSLLAFRREAQPVFEDTAGEALLAPPVEVTLPSRPYRSPGTASFLVSRDLPSATEPDAVSASGSSPSHTYSTSTATTSTGATATLLTATTHVARTAYLAPPAVDVSHFSDPSSPASSASSATSAGEDVQRRVAVSPVRAEVGRLRRCASLPELSLP